MSSAEIKQQLHSLIERVDSELLELAYFVLNKPERALNLNQSQIEELEKGIQLISRIPVKAQVGMKKEFKFPCNKTTLNFAGPPRFMVCFWGRVDQIT